MVENVPQYDSPPTFVCFFSECRPRRSGHGPSPGHFYAAANEFEWARKLMPGHPDPPTNLALTLERAGQEDRALAEYDAALEVYAGYMPALQGRTALALRLEGGGAS